MGVDEAAVGAPEEAAASVANLQRPADGREMERVLRLTSRGVPRSLSTTATTAVATQAAGGLGGQGGAVLQLAASLGVAGQHLGVGLAPAR